MTRPRPPLRSTTARLAWGAAAAFLAGFWLISAFAYVTLSSLLEHDARERVMADAGGLVDLYRRDGRDVLLSEVRQRVADAVDPDALYAVVDARTGVLLAGNLRDIAPHGLRAGWLPLADGPEGTPRRVHVSALDADVYLATGVRMRAAAGFNALALRTALMATVFALVLGALLGHLVARWVTHRLRRLEETAAQVGDGEIDRRVPLDGSDDAFERLAMRFNAMLDRIGGLLTGVRDATDHIAHDLRTPLTRLRSRLEALRMEASDEERSLALDAAVGEVDQLLASSNALLRLARVQSQPKVDDDPLVALDRIARDAIDLYEPIATERGIRMDAEAVAPVSVRGDADQLFQATTNLLDNAIKYSPAGGTVGVAVRASMTEAVIVVSDEGDGIPVAERARVFDRYYRLERHRRSPGTGLGLSLVQAVVHRHGGQIHLDDHRPGLRVTVRLPLPTDAGADR
jgi:signal transduction histidine kinase